MAKMHKFKVENYLEKVIILDNSVLVKAFIEEDGSDIVDKLFALSYTRQLTLMAPVLIIFEFLNVLSKAFKDEDMVKNAYAKFKKLQMTLINPDDTYVLETLEDVCNRKISYYDASYHALAKDFDTVFLTADRKYYEAMKDRGNVELFE